MVFLFVTGLSFFDNVLNLYNEKYLSPKVFEAY